MGGPVLVMMTHLAPSSSVTASGRVSELRVSSCRYDEILSASRPKGMGSQKLDLWSCASFLSMLRTWRQSEGMPVRATDSDASILYNDFAASRSILVFL